jgi:manganese/zinc/iron transport system substrate-binding protein
MLGTLGIRRPLATWALRAMLAAALLIPSAHVQAKPKLLATIAQLGEPLARMLEGCAEVESLLGPGVDPHLYRLTRTDTAKALAADGIIANGLNLEAQMRVLFGRLAARKPVFYAAELLDTGRIIRPDGKAADPHVWMDPTLWSDALSKTGAAIAVKWPDCAAVLATTRPKVLGEIAATDAYVEARLASVTASTRVLVTAHDAFGYYGRRYGLEVLGVQGISTESEAGVAHIRDLARLIFDRRVRAVFAETSTADRAVEAVIEGAVALGADVVKGPALFSDAMGPPGRYEGTYIGMLDHNATAIARALGGAAPLAGMRGRLTTKG